MYIYVGGAIIRRIWCVDYGQVMYVDMDRGIGRFLSRYVTGSN